MRARKVAALACAGGAGVLILYFALRTREPKRTPPSPAEAALGIQIAGLEDKIARLEKQMSEQRALFISLEAISSKRLDTAMELARLEQLTAARRGVPEGSVPQTFNGNEFYLVPLAQPRGGD